MALYTQCFILASQKYKTKMILTLLFKKGSMYNPPPKARQMLAEQMSVKFREG